MSAECNMEKEYYVDVYQRNYKEPVYYYRSGLTVYEEAILTLARTIKPV